MEYTWPRDLRVLKAIVEVIDQDRPFPLQVRDVARTTAIDEEEVLLSVRALNGEYIELDEVPNAERGAHRILGVTPAARPVVGQWPSPESALTDLLKALETAIEEEQDPEQKSRLRKAFEGVLGLTGELTKGVGAAWLARVMGIG